MVTPGLGQGYAVQGKRQKTQSNRKNIGERSEPSGSLADFLFFLFFFFRPRRFSPPFSPDSSDSSSVVPKLSLLINYLLGKRLGCARGEDGKASFPSSPSLKRPLQSSLPNTDNERRLGMSHLFPQMRSLFPGQVTPSKGPVTPHRLNSLYKYVT